VYKLTEHQHDDWIAGSGRESISLLETLRRLLAAQRSAAAAAGGADGPGGGPGEQEEEEEEELVLLVRMRRVERRGQGCWGWSGWVEHAV
jgi:hypothetical protein